MITTKEVKVFDVKNIPLNAFITFEMRHVIDNEDNEDVVETDLYNGIITKVSEEEIAFITSGFCPIKGIHISAVIGPTPRVVIKGIRSSLIYEGNE